MPTRFLDAIRPVRPDDAAWVRQFIAEEWGADVVVAHGEVFRPLDLPGFIAEAAGTPVGLLTYNVVGGDCEIVTINSLRQGGGIGTALVEAAKAEALRLGCRRLWLVTTNDNLAALRFYQKRGFELVAVHRGAVERSRRLKPSVPFVGHDGIPIRDEIELEMPLNRA